MTADGAGGVWTYALELVEALAAHDVDVALATMGPALSLEQRAEARASAGDVFESEYALEWMDEPWREVEAAGAWLLELEDQVQPDVVHLNGFAHAALGWRAPVLVVAHSDVLSWWEAVRGAPAPATWSAYRDAVESGLRAADAVAAPTAAYLSTLERLYDFETDRLVIPNGRRALRARPKEPYVAAAGRFWDEAKNLAALERVAPRLPWPVRVAGAREPLAPSAVAELVARASVFAAPARYEPFGLAALEAASAGCALVLGDIPTLREVWDDAAVYVSPDDVDALEAALRDLLADEAARADLARRARERAARYAPEPMATAYRRVYDSVNAARVSR